MIINKIDTFLSIASFVKILVEYDTMTSTTEPGISPPQSLLKLGIDLYMDLT